MLNLYTELEGVLRLLLSLICGAFIGLDRERGHRPAGLRTHTLVSMGACLVMVTSIWATEKYGYPGDPMRMSAQVISGIGFLGAGTIIKGGHGVRGLTTAAGLWTTACIGLAVGAGYYIGGLFTTILVLGTLKIFKKIESRMESDECTLVIHAHPSRIEADQLVEHLISMGANVTYVSAKQKEDDLRVSLRMQRPPDMSNEEIALRMMKVEGVESVQEYECTGI